MRLDPALQGPLLDATRLVVGALDPAALLMFGSRASGRARTASDHDLAVLVGRREKPDWQLLRRLQLDLEDRLGSDVDLVVLDDSSPILAREVLRDGRLLDNRDPQALEDFLVRTLTDYEDLKITRAPIERRLLGGKPQ